MRRPPAALALTAALVLGLAACGDDGDEEDTSASTTEATSSTTQASGSSTTAAEGSTTTAAEGSTTTAPGDGDLPGEPIDIYPYEGAHLGVVGVAAGDTLNVRSGPGTGFDVVAELNPLSQEPTATGRNRTLDDDSLWVEVTVDDGTGWVNGAFVAQPGAVVDITDDVGPVSAVSMEVLAEGVAATRVFDGEGPTPTVTIVAGPDGGEVSVDVIGLADDAQKGERLLIVATEGGEGFNVSSVESIALCARGVTDDGLCT
jgi:hypothetical protein